jgi:hypothetical protein
MVRARYGTGVFLKLNKRECNIRIRLTPIGADFMRVHLRIGKDNHYFYPSCVMGDQFSSFLTAVYCLYNEGYSYHQLHSRQWKRRFGCEFQTPSEENGNRYFMSIPVSWDEEGRIDDIILSRSSAKQDYFSIAPKGVPDPIGIEISYKKGNFKYTVDGRDLCYAVAKGYTEALKKYGFQGYLRSTGMQYIGDTFEMEELLFVKAYALDAMESRVLQEAWKHPKGWMSADFSSFEKEIELLLFDM